MTTMEGEPFSVFERSVVAAAPGVHEVCGVGLSFCSRLWAGCPSSILPAVVGVHEACSQHRLSEGLLWPNVTADLPLVNSCLQNVLAGSDL